MKVAKLPGSGVVLQTATQPLPRIKEATASRLPEETSLDLRKCIEWLTEEGYCVRQGPHLYRPTPRAESVYREYRLKSELCRYFETQGVDQPQQMAEALRSLIQLG